MTQNPNNIAQQISHIALSHNRAYPTNFPFQPKTTNCPQSQFYPLSSLPNPPKSIKQRNRRYTKLKQLCKEGYFQQEEIMLRSPRLYYQYVGRYKKYERGDKFASMSQFLQAQIVNMEYRQMLKKLGKGNWEKQGNARLEQMSQQSGNTHDEQQQHISMRDSFDCRFGLESEQQQFGQQLEQIDQEELHLLQQSLIDLLYEQFLFGRAEGFDYRQIDGDEGLDDWKLMDLDEEERYFSEGIEESGERDPEFNTGIQDF